MAAAPHQHEDSQLCACSFLAEPRVRGLLRVITLCCSSCEKRVPVSCRRSLSEHTLAALKDPTTYGLVEGVWYCWNAVIAGYESHMLACIFDVDSSQLSVALADVGRCNQSSLGISGCAIFDSMEWGSGSRRQCRQLGHMQLRL